ncbi:hypothetical protein GCM10017744_096130 [Streptomyces antimycoticus]
MCDILLWAAMSSLWSWAALVSFSFTVSGSQPALLRSLLTRSTTSCWSVAAAEVAAGEPAVADCAIAAEGMPTAATARVAMAILRCVVLLRCLLIHDLTLG